MPKIPTFTATGSIEQLAGTTSNIKIDPNANIFSALKPVTDAVVNFKIKENDAQNKTEALKLENDFITDMQKVYEEVNVLENKEIANQILKTKSNIIKPCQSDIPVHLEDQGQAPPQIRGDLLEIQLGPGSLRDM